MLPRVMRAVMLQGGATGGMRRSGCRSVAAWSGGLLGGSLRLGVPRCTTVVITSPWTSPSVRAFHSPPPRLARPAGRAPAAGAAAAPAPSPADALGEDSDVEDADVTAEWVSGDGEGLEAGGEDGEELEEPCDPGIDTSGLSWAETALRLSRELLSTRGDGGARATVGAIDQGDEADNSDDFDALEPVDFSLLELYDFRVLPSGPALHLRLDKPSARYGSPTLGEMTAFAGALRRGLEAALGEAAAGELDLEVSSPGAERKLRLPGELKRFADLPLTVRWSGVPAQAAAGSASQTAPKEETAVLRLVSGPDAAGDTVWTLASTRATRRRRSRRRQREEEHLSIPLAAITAVNIYLDI